MIAAAPSRRAIALAVALALCLGTLLATSSSTSSANAAPSGSGNDPHIVGGAGAPAARYPWFAQLEVETGQGTAQCGGALVTPVAVLTAAHCVKDITGARATFGQDQRGLGGQVVEASDATSAADYNEQTFDNDYGFVILAQPVTAYPTIKLAGPSETALWRAGRSGAAMGFGNLSEGGTSSPTLQEIALPVLADSTCGAASSYGTFFRPLSMLCVGYPEGGRSTCQGDSGGPLAVPADGGVWRIAGLVSFARGCARPGFPSVFTRAADPAFSARIQQKLNDYKATFPSAFPGIYSDTNIIGSGALPAGCGTAQAAAGNAAAAAAGSMSALDAAKAEVKKVKKQLQKAKRTKNKADRQAAIKKASKKIKKASKKAKKTRKKVATAEPAATAAAQASAAASATATTACN